MTPPNSLSAAAFPQSLAQEAKLVEQFVTVLQQEQTAISEGATERLADYKEQINQRLFLYKSLCMFNDEYADCFLIYISHKLFISSGILILFSASIHQITGMFYIYRS